MSERQVYTPRELARETNIGRSATWINERCGDGTLPHIRIGARIYLRRADLIAAGWLTAEGGGTDKSEARVAARASEISPEHHTRKDAIS